MPHIPKRKKRPWLTGEHKASQARFSRNKFYQTSNWRKLRAVFIKQHPLCVECGSVGRVVDHIKPIADGGESLAWENLQTMCHRCHNVKSGRESRR